MKKTTLIILTVVVIIILLIFIIPFSIGVHLKNNYQKILTAAAKSPNLSLKLEKFHRGWFSSDATVDVTWKPQGLKDTGRLAFAKLIQLRVKQHIVHGPIVWVHYPSNLSKLVFAKAIIYNKSKHPNLSFSSVLELNFDHSLRLNLFSKKLVFKSDTQKLTLEDTRSQLYYSPHVKQIKGSIVAGVAILQTKANQQTHQPALIVRMDNPLFQFNLKKIAPLWYGHRAFSASDMTLSTPQKPVFLTIVQIKGQVNMTRKANTTNITMTHHIQSIFNKQLKLSPITLTLSINKLNSSMLSQLVTASIKQAQNPSQAYDSLYTPFINLLNKGLEVNVKHFIVGTTYGSIKLHAKLILPTQKPTSTLDTLAKSASATLTLQIPKTWLVNALSDFYSRKTSTQQNHQEVSTQQLADTQVQAWITNNKLIVIGQKDLQITLSYKKGKLMINDSPITQEPKTAPAPVPTTPTVTKPSPQQKDNSNTKQPIKAQPTGNNP